MARAETITLLPLDRYATIMRMSVCHFNQVDGVKAPLRSGCDDVWDQPEREDLAWAMATAEEMIAHELGFWPAPKWMTWPCRASGTPSYASLRRATSRAVRPTSSHAAAMLPANSSGGSC